MKQWIIVCYLFCICVTVSAQTRIFWTDDGTDRIQSANPDGTNVQNIITTGITTPRGIAIDEVNGKIYWADDASNKILRANLDGSTPEDLITTGIEIPAFIALDVSHGKVYWTDSGTTQNNIRRANLNGTNVENVVSSLNKPTGIAIDSIHNKLYWIERVGKKICRANLDGTGAENLITTGLTSPYALTLDPVSGKMYFTDFGSGKIQKANLDGSGIADVATGLGVDVDAITINNTYNQLYFTTYSTKIRKVNVDGTGLSDLITGLSKTTSIAFYTPTIVISGNTTAPEVVLSYTDSTPKTAVSDSSGNYAFSVSYGWTGTVTPSKAGFSFSPTNLSYTNVTTNQTAQNYSAAVPAPVATAATSIGTTFFTANWNAVAGATGYRLDVATDAGFTTMVTGYNNRDVGNVTSYVVNSGLNPNTSYFYRLRAINSGITSPNSNSIELKTLTVTHDGDVNNDGAVNATDLAIVLNVVAGNLTEGTPPCTDPLRGDFNGSGHLEATDLQTLANRLAGNA